MYLEQKGMRAEELIISSEEEAAAREILVQASFI
ncbi:hypothetical protein ES707_09275 [subsurface metagenome]